MPDLNLKRPKKNYNFFIDAEVTIRRRYYLAVTGESRIDAVEIMRQQFLLPDIRKSPYKYEMEEFNVKEKTVKENEGKPTRSLHFEDGTLIKNNAENDDPTLVHSGHPRKSQEYSEGGVGLEDKGGLPGF